MRRKELYWPTADGPSQGHAGAPCYLAHLDAFEGNEEESGPGVVHVILGRGRADGHVKAGAGEGWHP